MDQEAGIGGLLNLCEACKRWLVSRQVLDKQISHHVVPEQRLNTIIQISRK